MRKLLSQFDNLSLDLGIAKTATVCDSAQRVNVGHSKSGASPTISNGKECKVRIIQVSSTGH